MFKFKLEHADTEHNLILPSCTCFLGTINNEPQSVECETKLVKIVSLRHRTFFGKYQTKIRGLCCIVRTSQSEPPTTRTVTELSEVTKRLSLNIDEAIIPHLLHSHCLFISATFDISICNVLYCIAIVFYFAVQCCTEVLAAYLY